MRMNKDIRPLSQEELHNLSYVKLIKLCKEYSDEYNEMIKRTKDTCSMIEEDIDNPAMEHLIEMAIMHTPSNYQLVLLEAKRNQFFTELESRMKS